MTKETSTNELKQSVEQLLNKLIQKNRELFEIEEQMNDIIEIQKKKQANK